MIPGAMSGRPFLQIPGPTNIPDRVLRAMDRHVVDHRSPEFAELTEDVRRGLRRVFGTQDGVPMLYPASGTGATARLSERFDRKDRNFSKADDGSRTRDLRLRKRKQGGWFP